MKKIPQLAPINVNEDPSDNVKSSKIISPTSAPIKTSRFCRDYFGLELVFKMTDIFSDRKVKLIVRYVLGVTSCAVRPSMPSSCHISVAIYSSTDF